MAVLTKNEPYIYIIYLNHINYFTRKQDVMEENGL